MCMCMHTLAFGQHVHVHVHTHLHVCTCEVSQLHMQAHTRVCPHVHVPRWVCTSACAQGHKHLWPPIWAHEQSQPANPKSLRIPARCAPSAQAQGLGIWWHLSVLTHQPSLLPHPPHTLLTPYLTTYVWYRDYNHLMIIECKVVSLLHTLSS